MKRFLSLLIIFSFIAINSFAGDLLAFHIVGKVMYKKGTEMVPLVMNTRISDATVISVPTGGKAEFLDETNKQRICISKPGNGAVNVLAKGDGNSVTALAGRYVSYVKNQMTNKGLVSQQRYTDFATVTRDVAKKEDENKDPFRSAFDNFAKSSRETFDTFRDKCNKEYTDFVRQIWNEFKGEPSVPKPKDEMIGPEVKTDTTKTDKFFLFELAKKIFKHKKTVPEQTLKEEAEPQPQPVEEIKEVVPVTEEQKEEAKFEGMPVTLFGTDFTVRVGESQRFHLDNINPNKVADALDYLSSKKFDNLLYDCLKIRKDYSLCDWAYFLLLKTISDQFCGEGTNEAALLCGWLYYQSGYKIRFAYSDDRDLYLLIASKHYIYDKHYPYKIDGEYFYPVSDSPEKLFICKASFPKEQSLSLYVNKSPKFTDSGEQKRVIKAKYHYPDFSIEVGVNPNLLSFYDTYPTSCVNDEATTRWQMYANTPLNDEVKNEIYPSLKKQLEGYNEKESVARLLDLVQTLAYEYDDKVWGYDRAFFAEESLHYPYCDCEDRTILLTRLVRDLLGLKCVMIYYPGHLAAAVHFSDDQVGACYEYKGLQYTVCDGAYLGAFIGEQMPCYDKEDNGAVVVPLE